jgi:hypothetical protein
MSNTELANRRFAYVFDDPEVEALYLLFIESIDLTKYTPLQVLQMKKQAIDDEIVVAKNRDNIHEFMNDIEKDLIEVVGPEGDIIPICEPIEYLQRWRTAMDNRKKELDEFICRVEDYLESRPKINAPKPPKFEFSFMKDH